MTELRKHNHDIYKTSFCYFDRHHYTRCNKSLNSERVLFVTSQPFCIKKNEIIITFSPIHFNNNKINNSYTSKHLWSYKCKRHIFALENDWFQKLKKKKQSKIDKWSTARTTNLSVKNSFGLFVFVSAVCCCVFCFSVVTFCYSSYHWVFVFIQLSTFDGMC